MGNLERVTNREVRLVHHRYKIIERLAIQIAQGTKLDAPFRGLHSSPLYLVANTCGVTGIIATLGVAKKLKSKFGGDKPLRVVGNGVIARSHQPSLLQFIHDGCEQTKQVKIL